jgi:AraC-like DNA-binding protein
MESCKIIEYSNVFLSCFSDNATKHTPMIREHGIVYVLSGKLEINESGKITYLYKGDCAFVRKDNRISMNKMPYKDEQYKSIWLTFPRSFLREFYQTLNKSQLPTDAKRPKISLQKLPADRPDIRSLFLSMTPYFNSPIAPTPELIRLKMTEGVYCLLNTDKDFYTALFDFSEPWKIDIMEYLNNNYMFDLSLAEIASFTGRSLATFKRDFRKISSLSPEKWLIQKRLDTAKQQLETGQVKVSDIYREVGFKNLSHFSTVFKETYGYAPSKIN